MSLRVFAVFAVSKVLFQRPQTELLTRKLLSAIISAPMFKNMGGLKRLSFYLFLLIIFANPFISSRVFPVISTANWAVAYLAFAILITREKNPLFYYKTTLSPIIVFFSFILLINQFVSINKYNSLCFGVSFASNLTIFFMTLHFSTEKKKSIILAILLSGIIICAYSIYQYFFGLSNTLKIISETPQLSNISRYERDFLAFRRAFGTFFSPDKLAAFLLYICFISTGVSFTPGIKKGLRLLGIMGTFISVSALLLTKSIGGLISLLICSIVFVALLIKNSNVRYKSALKLTALIFLSLFLMISFLILNVRLDETLRSFSIQNSLIQRLGYWKSALSIIGAHPFAGIGLDNFNVLYTKYKNPLSDETRYAHNSFLQIFAEAGIFGFISIICLFLFFLKSAFRKIGKSATGNLDAGIFCASLSFIIRNLFDYDLYVEELSFLWWISVGLITPVIKTNKSDGLISLDHENTRLKIPDEQSLKIQSSQKPPFLERTLTVFSLGLIFFMLAFRLFNGISLMFLKTSEEHIRNKEYENSIKILKRTVLLMPIYDKHHNRLAKSYEFLISKDKLFLEKAISEYKEANRLNPFSAYNHLDLGVVLLRNNKVGEALKELKIATDLYPTNIEFYIYIQEAQKKLTNK